MRLIYEDVRPLLMAVTGSAAVEAVERVWSTYGWTQSKLRNRLLPAKARKLVMVHCHLLMLRMQKEGKWEEDLLEWHGEDEMWEVREEGGRRTMTQTTSPCRLRGRDLLQVLLLLLLANSQLIFL